MALLTVIIALASGFENPPQQDTPPRLVAAFRDSFDQDTRSLYETDGDVSWQPGQLTLQSGASIRREIAGGTWAKVDLESAAADKDRSPTRPTEFRIWFVLNGATDCCVRWRTTHENGATHTSVTVVDTAGQDGTSVEQPVREATVTGRHPAQLTVEYHRGLVRVSQGTKTLLRAYIDNGNATVDACKLSTTSPLAASTIRALAVPAPSVPTELQQQQLDDAAAASDELGEMLRSGRYQDALQLAKSALGLYRTVLGEMDSDYAASLNNLGFVHERLGSTAEAEACYRRATEIQKLVLGVDHPDYAGYLGNLAVTHYRSGDFASAKAEYQRTMRIYENVFGKVHPEYARTASNLASLHSDLGEFDRAEELGQAALSIRRTLLGEEHPDYATSLNNLAFLYQRLGDYSRAEPLYKSALAIRKKAVGVGHPDYATGLNNLGLLYQKMGDYAQAEPILKEAIERAGTAFGETHTAYATLLNNLALLYHSVGELEQSETLYRRASEIKRAALGEQHPEFATCLDNLASLYKEMGRIGQAVELTREASSIYKTQLGERHPGYAKSLGNLASLTHRRGDGRRAEELASRAAAIFQSAVGKDHPNYATSLVNLATIIESNGDAGRAEPLVAKAAGIVRRHLDRNAVTQSERQQLRNQSEYRHFLDMRLTLLTHSVGKPTDVLESLWRWKGAVTLRQQAYRRVASQPELRAVFDELRSVTRQLAALSRRAPIPPPETTPAPVRAAFDARRADWEHRVTALSVKREELEQQVAARSVPFRELVEPLTLDAVRQFLTPNTAFIDFLEYNHSTPKPDTHGQFDFERRYIGLVVRSDQPPAAVELGGRQQLAALIRDFRRPFTNAQSRADGARPATDLRERLWAPLEKHLDGVDTVIISPDTALGTLPFCALPGRTADTYLIEEYKFASIPLAGILRSMSSPRPRPDASRGLLVLGDVAYDAESVPTKPEPGESRPGWIRRSAPRTANNGKWLPLPASQPELLVVRDVFKRMFGGRVTTLRGTGATEAEFIRQAPRHYNLHLVTHGFFAGDEFAAVGAATPDVVRKNADSDQGPTTRALEQFVPGLLSGLVLAGANNEPSADTPEADGILTASEIETLDLSAVDLVVLSACETGLGKAAGGEGLTGIQRAFHVAGARSCIATLWEVDDKATLEIMSRFYRYYWEGGRSKIDALHQAQLDVLSDRSLTRGDPRERKRAAVPAASAKDTERTDPRYWAAFVLSGDWR